MMELKETKLDLHTVDQFGAFMSASTTWRAEIQHPEAKELMKQLGYETDWMDEIDALIPRNDYGPGNVNTGYRHWHWHVGREENLVLYVHIVKTYMPEDFDYDLLARQVTELIPKDQFKEYGPEALIHGHARFEYRLWRD